MSIMKQSQTSPKGFLGFLMPFLLSALVFSSLGLAAPVVIPANNETAFHTTGRDWRKPHTPLSLIKGGIRPAPVPTQVKAVVAKQTDVPASPLTPQEQTAVYLDYLRTQREGKVKVPVITEDNDEAPSDADPKTVEEEDQDEEEDTEEELQKRGVIRITEDMVKTGKGLPSVINMEDVPEFYRHNPHIQVHSMPKNEAEQNKIQNLAARSEPHMIVHADKWNLHKPTDSGKPLDYVTTDALDKDHIMHRILKQLNDTIYSPSYNGGSITIANPLNHPPPSPSTTGMKSLGKRLTYEELAKKKLPKVPPRVFPNGKSLYDYQFHPWRTHIDPETINRLTEFALMAIATKRFNMWTSGRGHGGATWAVPDQHNKPVLDHTFAFQGLMQSQYPAWRPVDG